MYIFCSVRSVRQRLDSSNKSVIYFGPMLQVKLSVWFVLGVHIHYVVCGGFVLGGLHVGICIGLCVCGVCVYVCEM